MMDISEKFDPTAEKPVVTFQHLRRLICVLIAQYFSEIFEEESNDKTENLLVVCFSPEVKGVKTPANWIKAMLKDGAWADSLMIKCVSMIWGLKITVLYEQLDVIHYRHEGSLYESDLLFIFVGGNGGNHYLAGGKL
jgi:hypothetical protein